MYPRTHPDATLIENDFLDRHAAAVGPTAVAIYWLLRRYASPDGDDGLIVNYLGINDIAAQIGTSRHSIFRHLKRLQTRGLVEIISNRGRTHQSQYLLPDPRNISV